MSKLTQNFNHETGFIDEINIGNELRGAMIKDKEGHRERKAQEDTDNTYKNLSSEMKEKAKWLDEEYEKQMDHELDWIGL